MGDVEYLVRDHGFCPTRVRPERDCPCSSATYWDGAMAATLL
jgi:hypothetical protein